MSYGTVQGYLRGLAAGLRIAGFEWTRDDYHAAAAARGWDPRGDIGILRDFTKKGLSDAEMARELIAVEADAYARAMARSGRSASPSAPADPGPFAGSPLATGAGARDAGGREPGGMGC